MGYSNSWVQSTPAANCDVVTSPNAHDVLLFWAVTDTAATFTWPGGFSELASHSGGPDGQAAGVAIKYDATGSEGTLRVTPSAGSAIGGVVALSSCINSSSGLAFTTVEGHNDAANPSPLDIDVNATPSGDGTTLISFGFGDVQGSDNVAFTVSTTAGTTGAWTQRQDQQSGFYNTAFSTATQTTAGAITVRQHMVVAPDQLGGCHILVGLLPLLPVITGLKSVVVWEGQDAVFSLTATYTGTASYQWKFNGSNVGTNSDTYTRVGCVAADNGGAVTCVVTDDNGSTTSISVALTVLHAPKLAWIKA